MARRERLPLAAGPELRGTAGVPGRAWLALLRQDFAGVGAPAAGDSRYDNASGQEWLQPAGRRRAHRRDPAGLQKTGALGLSEATGTPRPPPKSPRTPCAPAPPRCWACLLLVSVLLTRRHPSADTPAHRRDAPPLTAGDRAARARAAAPRSRRAGRILQYHGRPHRACPGGAARAGGTRAPRVRAHPPAASPRVPRPAHAAARRRSSPARLAGPWRAPALRRRRRCCSWTWTTSVH